MSRTKFVVDDDSSLWSGKQHEVKMYGFERMLQSLTSALRKLNVCGKRREVI